MQYVKLAKVSDFAGRRMKSYTILARKIGIIREPDGSFYAIEVACKHQNADLTQGRVDGDEVTCPRHGWVYNIRTGHCLTHNSAKLRRHDLKIEGDDIYVSLHPIE